MSSNRFQQMQQWLASLTLIADTSWSHPEPASSDASFRRYFRIQCQAKDGPWSSLIIMDAPPEQEDCRPFVQIAQQLQAMELSVPLILAQDLTQGFLLLTDLGSQTYLSVLNDDNVDDLYSQALKALSQMQQRGQADAPSLPLFNEALYHTEMALFNDWLMAEHLDLRFSPFEQSEWQRIQATLIQSAQRQPQVYVHRDYHSRNLMFLGEGQSAGILDFQDAVKGPLTYDAVSMVRDCYIAWQPERVTEWQRESFLLAVQAGLVAKQDWADYVRAMDLMGIQRHLKAAGIFARLAHRDGKTNYLNDVPTTLNYIYQVGQCYPELRFLVDWVEQRMLPLFTTPRQSA